MYILNPIVRIIINKTIIQNTFLFFIIKSTPLYKYYDHYNMNYNYMIHSLQHIVLLYFHHIHYNNYIDNISFYNPFYN